MHRRPVKVNNYSSNKVINKYSEVRLLKLNPPLSLLLAKYGLVMR